MNRTGNDVTDGTCVVCCRNSVLIFSLGECDHPVCYECATRMRVLGGQNECAICRRPLPKVMFVRERKPYASISNVAYQLLDRKYQIFFEDQDVQEICYRLLEHRCKVCRTHPTYATFGQLKDHMRREHERHYCDLCVENLTAFTHERKCYNRADLARHRRVGDVDDTSHRGHPLCEFCDERYVDNDALFRHLRREHFYCHFCDADGLHHYYSDYEYLREHFRVEHFQCADEACREERFTTAFRTEIDLKAHRATVHNRNLTKAQSKQARTLELEFSITPRVLGGATASAYGRSSTYASGVCNETDMQDVCMASHHRKSRRGDYSLQRNGATTTASSHPSSDRNPFNVIFTGQHNNIVEKLLTPDIDLNSEQFPMLGDNNITIVNSSNNQEEPGNSKHNHTVDTLARKLAKLNRFTVSSTSIGNNNRLGDTEFPALGPSYGPLQASSTLKSTKTAYSQKSWTSSGNLVVKASSNHVAPNTKAAKKTLTVKLNSKDDFPGLVTKKVAQPLNIAVQVSQAVISQRQNGGYSAAASPVAFKRQGPIHQPVVTSVTSSQNITFLNSPISKTTKVKMKEQNRKSDDGFVVPKSEKNVGAVKKRGGGGGSGNSKSSSAKVNDNEDFPVLQIKKSKEPVTVDKSKEKLKQKSVVNVTAIEHPIKNLQEPSIDSICETQIENEENEYPDFEIPLASSFSPVNIGFNGMSIEDFPEIKGRNLKTEKAASMVNSNMPPPPGFGKLRTRETVRPPPGFPSQTLSSPPPGFTQAIVTSSDSSSAMTFTNSNGKKFTLPTTAVKLHEYLQPDSFQARNQKLMERLADTFMNKEKFATFRLLSGLFRKGEIMAADYYRECFDILGQDEFSMIFPELLVLLPDIQKQQMLLVIHKSTSQQHQQLQSNKKNNNTKSEPTTPAVAQQILVCATCQQALSVTDFHTHMDHHSLDEDFPCLLGSASTLNVVHQLKKAT